MLARQLLIGFLAAIVPSTILLGALTFYASSSLDRLSAELVAIAASREAVTDLEMTLIQTGAPLGSFLLTRDPANRTRFETLVAAAKSKLQSCAGAPCHQATQTPALMADAVMPAVEELERAGRSVFGGPDVDTRDIARGVELVRRTVGEVRSQIAPMLAAVRVRGDELRREADAVRARLWILIAVLTSVVVVGGALAARLVAGRIVRPLNDLLLGIRRVIGGDWTSQVKADAPGEIGELASAFNVMVGELRVRRTQLEEQNRTLEERVRERTEELRLKEQALGQSEKLASLGLLAAGVAHELNNPLTSIVMNANLLLEDVHEGTPLARDLKKIDADAARCRRIIDDLRAFARVRQMERVVTDVESLVDEAVSSTSHEFERRRIAVSRDLAPDLPKVFWDPVRMGQVLVNLLVNAAQAADGVGHVVIRVQRDGDWVRLEVEDDGPGIPLEDRNNIFDPFFTTKADGTGLGLSICHGIVEDHGGRIEVVSQTREDAGPDASSGTRVRVLIPLAESAA